MDLSWRVIYIEVIDEVKGEEWAFETGGKVEETRVREVYCVSQNLRKFNEKQEASRISMDEEWDKATGFNDLWEFLKLGETRSRITRW